MATRTGQPVSGARGEEEIGAIRGDIERTRGELSRTVDAIEERLSPAHLKEQVTDVKDHVVHELRDAKDHLKQDLAGGAAAAKARVRRATVGRMEDMAHDARESMTRARSTAAETIRENPVPAAIAAIGLGWLFMSARRESRGYEPRRRERSFAVGERVRHVGHDVGEAGRRAARTTSRQVRRAEQSFEGKLRENPLAFGAVAVAIGAAIGLSLPHTEKEDRLMGETKERLLHEAEGAAEGALQKAQEKIAGQEQTEPNGIPPAHA